MERHFRSTLAILLACFLFVPLSASAAPPVELFARLPQLSNPQLSPNGEYMAMEMSYKGSRVLVVRDVYGREPPAVVNPGDVLLHGYEWVSDDRLILSVRATARFRGSIFNYLRLISVDKLGQNLVPLQMKPNDQGFYNSAPHVVSSLPGDDTHILAVLNDRADRFNYPEVDKVNILTGRSERVQDNKRAIISWMADGDGALRLGVAYNYQGRGQRGREVTVYYRESEDADWETLQTGDAFDENLMYPFQFAPGNGKTLLVSSTELAEESAGREEVELYRFDLNKRELSGKYVDEVGDALRERVKQEFNMPRAIVVSRDDADARIIVKAFGDTRPASFYLYEKALDRLSYLGGEYPQLEEFELSPMTETAYAARDGREIPAYLTLPAGTNGKNLPVVVYPHGGPWARDYWGFDNYVQFFASRGYAVLQPQFRGSTGFGNEHLEAGFGEWGFAIQDDISDGVAWLVKEGIADPKRICIYGASFGGYAAAVGAATTPDLYRCAITENGVLDLKRLIDDADTLLFEDVNRATWNSWDEAKDASPYHLYKNIQIPVLVIASENDTVVPYKDHSNRFYKRLKKTDPAVEFVLLEKGEHWRTNEAHELIKMERIIEFLDRNIGTVTATQVLTQ